MPRLKRLRPGFLAVLALGVAFLLGGEANSSSPIGPQAAAAAAPGDAEPEGGHGGGHTEVFTVFLLGLAVVVVVAMIGRWLASLCHQPAVLGELLMGAAVGNVGYWLGLGSFALVMHLGGRPTGHYQGLR